MSHSHNSPVAPTTTKVAMKRQPKK